MGRGDKRSFKGKVFKGSFGKTRPRHPAKKATVTAHPATPAQQQQHKKK